ncbi:MAG TPA: tetratricopeptide repeat protein [Kofleriaceae bacterium]|jgi:hypothetical protein|nr:tetratricopeptide repeat protein [Kofleriaceae bacterium]
MSGRLIIAIIGIALWAAPVRADRLADAKREVTAADIAYRLGRFDEALAGYTRAYELYPVPALLFNIGQCHKNLHDYARAVFFFEGYLRDAPAATNRALVEDLIREARAQLAQGAPPPATPAPPPSAPPPNAPSPVAPPPAEPPAPVPIDRSEMGAPAGGAAGKAPRSVVLPSLLIGGGIAAAVGGGVFYYYGQKRGPDDKYVYDDTRLLGGTLMLLGGGAIAAGAFLVFHGGSSSPVVAVTPDGARVGWTGAF